MKLYHVIKTRLGTEGAVFTTYATELGLSRMGASIHNRGTSYAGSEEARAITERLGEGELIRDPHDGSVFWEAQCLGAGFHYCSGIAFLCERDAKRIMTAR